MCSFGNAAAESFFGGSKWGLPQSGPSGQRVDVLFRRIPSDLIYRDDCIKAKYGMSIRTARSHGIVDDEDNKSDLSCCHPSETKLDKIQVIDPFHAV